MVKDNIILIENKKPFETVRELKNDYEVPSFEEFMKTYEADDKVIDSYENEIASYGDIEVNKGAGPTTYGDLTCYINYKGTTYSYQNRFLVILESEWGVDGQWFFGIPTYNSPKRSIDSFSDEARRFIDSVTVGSYSMNGIWQSGYMRTEIMLRQVSQAEELLRHFASGGLKVSGRGNVHHRGAQNDIINTVNTALETYRNGGEVDLRRIF